MRTNRENESNGNNTNKQTANTRQTQTKNDKGQKEDGIKAVRERSGKFTQNASIKQKQRDN